MAKITEVSHPPKLPARRPRVAAYARVSSDTDQLLHSASAQVSYYNELIQSNPDWDFAGIYADIGISGTQLKNRSEFQRLLDDCDAGKIDIVLTKSVSRFARNTVDLLSAVRRLKELGVEVRFEREHISTFTGEGELMLTIMASFAQEESRSISTNVKWRYRKDFEKGVDAARNKAVFGYRYDGEKYVIQPEEAEAVRYMFKRALEGARYAAIARELNAQGVKTVAGYEFDDSKVGWILRNEIYIGDRRLQKTFVDENHVHKINRGEFPQYYVTDCHEPIVSKEDFAMVQEVRGEWHSATKDRPFQGRIFCEECGGKYVPFRTTYDGKDYWYWRCNKRTDGRYTCHKNNLSEAKLTGICAKMLGLKTFDAEVFQKRVKLIFVQANGDLRFVFRDGTPTKTYKKLRTAPSEQGLTVSMCFNGKVRCAACENLYHRSMPHKKYCYWYCGGTQRRGGCYAPRCTDYLLRAATAEVLGQEELDDASVEAIALIEVQQTGDLVYKFKDGSVKTWQKW